MQAKKQAALGALSLIEDVEVLGIGTGSTVDELIALLPTLELPTQIVSSSDRTTQALEKAGIKTVPINSVGGIDLYIDGADQVLASGVAIKGGGGAHTLEKCLAYRSKRYIGIVDASKLVKVFDVPVPLEVMISVRSLVSREIAASIGTPHYREGFITDNGQEIVDISGIDMRDPLSLEAKIKAIPGVIESGIFAKRRFDQLVIGYDNHYEIQDC